MDEIGGDPGASVFAGTLSSRMEGLDRLLWIQSHKPNLIGRLLALTHMNARGLLLLLLCLLLLALLPIIVERLLRRSGMVRPNFQQVPIPQCFGLVLLLFVVLAVGTLLFLVPSAWVTYGDWLWLVAGFGLLGFIDDVWGNRLYRGLKGHFRALLKDKRVTTGLIKAVGGVLLAGWFAWRMAHGFSLQFVFGTLLIALGANTLNLFDLRPGRACALFLASTAPLLIGFWWQGGWSAGVPPLLFVVLPAWRVWEKDARAEVMLGDTGSNLLGAVLGFACAQERVPLVLQGVVLFLFIVVHIVAEKTSLTVEIERRPILRFLDGLTGVR